MIILWEVGCLFGHCSPQNLFRCLGDFHFRQKRLETCPGLRMQGLVMPFWAHRKRATSRFGASARRGVCYREFEGNAISSLIFITLLMEFRKFMVPILLIFSLEYE